VLTKRFVRVGERPMMLASRCMKEPLVPYPRRTIQRFHTSRRLVPRSLFRVHALTMMPDPSRSEAAVRLCSAFAFGGAAINGTS